MLIKKSIYETCLELPSIPKVFCRLSLGTFWCFIFIAILGFVGLNIPELGLTIIFVPPLYTGMHFGLRTGKPIPVSKKIISLILWVIAQIALLFLLLVMAPSSTTEYKGEIPTIDVALIAIILLGLPYLGFTYMIFHFSEKSSIESRNKKVEI